MFEKIRKRDGRIVKFDPERITNAISKAGAATGEFDRDIAKKVYYLQRTARKNQRNYI